MSHFFRLVKPTWPLVILLEEERKKKKSHPFIMNRETPTGFCHWDEKKKKGAEAQPLSALKQRAF